jgi:hypothetical protein
MRTLATIASSRSARIRRPIMIIFGGSPATHVSAWRLRTRRIGPVVLHRPSRLIVKEWAA